MGTLIQMPRQVRAFALSAAPGRPGSMSKFVLTATPWNSDEQATSHGFVELADLLDELAELGADRSMIGSVSRAMEVGRACVIPKLWLTPPQIEFFKEPVKRTGLLRNFTSDTDRTPLTHSPLSNQILGSR
jgi:hypothetical protein